MEQGLFTKCLNMYSRLFNDWDKDRAGIIYFVSDFIWSSLRSLMGVIPNPKMAFIFQISCILALISQFL